MSQLGSSGRHVLIRVPAPALILAAALSLAGGAGAHEAARLPAAPEDRPIDALVLPSGRGAAEFEDLLQAIRDAGGWPAVAAPPGGILAHLPPGADAGLESAFPGVRVHRGPLGDDTVRGLGTEARLMAQAFAGVPDMRRPPDGPRPDFGNDARVPPEPVGPETLGASDPSAPSSLDPRVAHEESSPRRVPPDGGFLDTTEYLAGTVAVGVIFLESACTDQSGCVNQCAPGIGCSSRCGGSIPGHDNNVSTCCENWTQARQDFFFASRISLGLANFARDAYRGYRFPPTFILKNFGTKVVSVEPVHGVSGQNAEAIWVNEALSSMGYNSGDSFWRSRMLDNDLRNSVYLDDQGNAIETDWAYTIYVVDSLYDCDGKFASDDFAYAWLGGPHLVLTSDSDGWETTEHFVIQHESNHIFYALDEYQGPSSCTERTGYFGIDNQNYEDPGVCQSNTSCTMRSDSTTFQCSWTQAQIGLRDGDGDGITDILDELPGITGSLAGPDPTDDPTPSFTGSAREVRYINRNPKVPTARRHHITVNRIVRVECAVDGGTFSDAAARDGAFDGADETWDFVSPPLLPGAHRFNCCAVNSVGNRSCTPESPFEVVDTDRDRDGIPNADDNCPSIFNPGQDDDDDDLVGDLCDNCVAIPNTDQDDFDGDLAGDACDPCPFDALDDDDSDGRCADVDNCPSIPNPQQENADGDDRGDACDACPDEKPDDRDGDGICAGERFGAPYSAARDNCPGTPNPGQADGDRDGLGDDCDPCPSDPRPPLDDIRNLRVSRDPDSGAIELVWTGSTGCIHDSYTVWLGHDPRPLSTPPDFPNDPSYTDVTAFDQDASSRDESFTFGLRLPLHYFFLVQDRGAAGEQGPLGAYGR